MPKRASKTGSELFIVDNSDQDWKALRYLRDWCQLSKSIDIATGFFEIGSLLALDGEWQKVDGIRILMGDEVSRRTRQAFEQGVSEAMARLDASLESEKETNDFLVGVAGVVDAIRSGQIQCRVYRKDKFHAKAYITHARMDVVGSSALVGSSNFTYPGLTENVELNVQITGGPVSVLQEWYEEHWAAAENVSTQVLKVIERHVREYMPFDVYAKALQEFFRGHEMTEGEWERLAPEDGGSHIYPILDGYQKQGYRALMKIARDNTGAFLCDAVGLGKTYIGLMIIERLIVHEGKSVALFAPKTARIDVWEPLLERYMPQVGAGGALSNLAVFSHTDLGRGGRYESDFQRVKAMADAIVIDEAHHFRNVGTTGTEKRGPSRYWQLFDLVEGPRGRKEMFFLTATPVNNRLDDFRHMAELFTQRDDAYFAKLGIHSLRGHFVSMEHGLERMMAEREGTSQADLFPTETNMADADDLLRTDTIFRELVVQRSRRYVIESQEQEGAASTSFPQRQSPKVAAYSVKKTYGRLLDMVEKAFAKAHPLFVLGIYFPLAYYKGPRSDINTAKNRQKQVVGLIRTMFLKRFESSAHAFGRSCDRLLLKLLAWAEVHSETDAEKDRLIRWKMQHAELIDYMHEHQIELFDGNEEDAGEDLITEEMLGKVEPLSRDEYRVEDILGDTLLDLDQVAVFLEELRKFKPRNDDKLKALMTLLTKDPVLSQHKVLMFTEFADTARYLRRHLEEAGITGIGQIDSGTDEARSTIIRCFAPYYNDSSSPKLAAAGKDEIRVLISTDVLSEGLNLQDATRLINYDIHWNPVRLMQRIGRVDRRMNPDVEAQLLADHPDVAELRGTVAYWNFLPPDELERLLKLYRRVSHKTLRISKTFGIEGRKLLKPEDDYEALKHFNEAYQGAKTPSEDMLLQLQRLLRDDPELAVRLDALPGQVFSGKEHPKAGARAVFLCYRIPRADLSLTDEDGTNPWTEEAGDTRWFLYDLESEAILEKPEEIVNHIRCVPDTPRHCTLEPDTLVDIRRKVARYINQTYMKRLQAPVGVKPALKAWMELS